MPLHLPPRGGGSAARSVSDIAKLGGGRGARYQYDDPPALQPHPIPPRKGEGGQPTSRRLNDTRSTEIAQPNQTPTPIFTAGFSSPCGGCILPPSRHHSEIMTSGWWRGGRVVRQSCCIRRRRRSSRGPVNLGPGPGPPGGSCQPPGARARADNRQGRGKRICARGQVDREPAMDAQNPDRVGEALLPQQCGRPAPATEPRHAATRGGALTPQPLRRRLPLVPSSARRCLSSFRRQTVTRL